MKRRRGSYRLLMIIGVLVVALVLLASYDPGTERHHINYDDQYPSEWGPGHYGPYSVFYSLDNWPYARAAPNRTVGYIVPTFVIAVDSDDQYYIDSWTVDIHYTDNTSILSSLPLYQYHMDSPHDSSAFELLVRLYWHWTYDRIHGSGSQQLWFWVDYRDVLDSPDHQLSVTVAFGVNPRYQTDWAPEGEIYNGTFNRDYQWGIDIAQRSGVAGSKEWHVMDEVYCGHLYFLPLGGHWNYP